MPQTMRAVEITEPGGPDVLKVTEYAVPAPGDFEVLIKIAAAGVNRPDVFQRMGLYPPPPGASDLPGLEVSGEIVALGDSAKAWNIGDKVCALLPGGGYAEFATVHEGAVLPVPRGLPMEKAAGLPETYFTVWANVFDDANLQAGETFLVHGGTSGIGVTAIAMAKAMGAKVFATASSDEKCDAIKALGADAAYRYDQDDWEKQIQDKGGADVILDMTGGDFVPRNLEALAFGGRHVSIATLRGMEATINIFAIMRKQLRLSGSTMKARGPDEKARLAAGLKETIWPLIEASTIKPVMDEIFDLVDAAEAHKRMESGAHIGKIVLQVA
ncbi:MAG: NAD(P)H-quinone oxidoreductase [Marinicaulis sp.]|nr:NAD(P)H-quinone oxidoreductase [Marinicaulis sp.]NNL88265.1 NAD(P)H-quinone oxidoreductase [Marinicaulis sp.]